MASIISAAIVSSAGKVIVSRQFQDISRIQIEGLLSAFPKLLGDSTDGSNNREYTVVESGSYRYVFQPAEALFLVVLSTTQSNIIEDLAALRMLGRLLPERCSTMDEQNVSRHAFEILFAFDEVVTNGQRELVSLEQVSSILEMFSAEEEMENEKKRERERIAKEHAVERAEALRKLKSEHASDRHFSGRDEAMGSSSGFSAPASQAPRDPVRGGYSDVADAIGSQNQQSSSSNKLGGAGLSLSSKTRRADALSKALKESGGAAASATANPGQQQQDSSSAAQQQQQQQQHSGSGEPVTLRVEEKISAVLNREGGVSSVDSSGTLFISIDDASASHIRVVMNPLPADFTAKSHPLINKDLYVSDHVLASKDNKPYPVGAAPLGVLRWRGQSTNSVKVPITVNCWPSATGASIEFELENQRVPLSNVRIALPLPGVSRAQVQDASCGSAQFDAAQQVLVWHIPSVDRGNSSGTLVVEIGTAATDDHFFPARVAFESNVSLAGASIVAVQNTETGARVPYSCQVSLVADEYIVN